MISALLDFLFPRTCVVCDRRLARTEHSVCASCLTSLPRILYKGGEEHGRIERLFWGRVPVVRATSALRYDSEEVRHIVHTFKYRQQPYVARDLAEVTADELSATDFFDGIDALVPMPLHYLRRYKRGYNQCDYIAEGIRRVTGIPVVNGVLKRVRNNPTQTHLQINEREQNVANIFRVVHPERLENKHILLIDDVMTTGSTLHAALQELQHIPGIRLSVFTIAYAGMMEQELV
ncbi:MAG: ComF family protein [Bacteroidaceae bacterium]|nr:ComF family protein [Bacteroidaceae bacterium]